MCRSRGLRGEWPTITTDRYHGDDDSCDNDEGSCCADEAAVPLPPRLREYGHQVGGHGLLCDDRSRILCDAGVLYKPVQQAPKGPQEVHFYAMIAREGSWSEAAALRQFLPRYHGLFRSADTGQFYLGLEDVLHGLRRPCVMDCKMGGRSTPPGASVSKHLLQKAMYAHREKVGFIVTGFKVHLPGRAKPKFYSILHGRCLSESGVYTKGLVPFLAGAGPRKRASCIASEVARQLRALRAWFDWQRSFQFYASSLLIAYEAAEEPTAGCPGPVVVRMVDFAHARRAEPTAGPDANYTLGLDNLIAYYDRAAVQFADVSCDILPP